MIGFDQQDPGSPFTVKIAYGMDDGSDTALGFSLFMLRAVTLFLIRIPQGVQYRLGVKTFYRHGLVTERTYTAVNKPLYLLFRLNLHHEGIDRVFQQMQRDFTELPPVPLAVQPETPRPVSPPWVWLRPRGDPSSTGRQEG